MKYLLDNLIPNVFNPAYWRNLWRQLKLVLRLTRDPQVPMYLKTLPFLVVAYLVSPFDIIPGFIPILGQLDDLALLVLGFNLFIRLAPADIVEKHKRELGLED
jgi:uncharacterized membrane protein YkvA (DUF1232 family)